MLGTGVFVVVGVSVTVGVFVGPVGVAVGVAVGVTVGVSVGFLGVFVGVAVGVKLGVFVGVLLGSGVSVYTGPVFVGVFVGVFDGTVGIGVSDGTDVAGPEVFVAIGVPGELDPRLTYPRMVRALFETNVREPNGTSLVKGLYCALTVTSTRSSSAPEFTTTFASSPLVASHTTNELVPGPWSYSTTISLSCKFRK